MTNSYQLLVTGLLFALLSPTFADDSVTLNGRSGAYIGAGGLYAIEDFDSGQTNFDSAAPQKKVKGESQVVFSKTITVIPRVIENVELAILQ